MEQQLRIKKKKMNNIVNGTNSMETPIFNIVKKNNLSIVRVWSEDHKLNLLNRME